MNIFNLATGKAVITETMSTETHLRSPGLRVLLEHSLFAVFEQAYGLFGLLGQVLHENAKILVVAQRFHLAFIAGQDSAEMLVSVWQQVQDVWRTILQGQLGVLA